MEPGGCALEERLPQSLAKYVPRLSLGTDGEGTWRLTVSSRPGEVEISLADDASEARLHRVVRADPEACAAAADGIGLILERYLSDLGYETGFTPLPEIPTATVATATVVEPPPPAEPPAVPSVAPRDIGMDLGVGALVLGVPGIRAGGILDVALEVPVLEAFEMQVSRFGAAPTRETVTLTVRTELAFFGVADGPTRPAIVRNGAVLGEYRVWTLGALARAGVCLDMVVVVPCLSAGVGVERVEASTRGGTRLFDQRRDAEAGALFDLAFRMALRMGVVSIYFRGELVIRPDPLVFSVDGADRDSVYRDGRVSGFVSLGLAVQLF